MWWLVANVASAHVGIENPPPRYPSDGFSDNKACPCGAGSNNGTCSGAERSDPNRSTFVTTYTAGQDILVTAHEVVGHAGRWRIAFDPDGADQADFDANILLDVADPPGAEGNVGQGDRWEWTVTLPNVPCTTCTLQLVQMMDGNTTDPVPDLIGHSSYYQCADLVLLAGTETDTDTDSDTDSDTDTDTDADTDADTDTDPLATGDSAADASAKGCGCDGGGGGAWGLVVVVAALSRARPARAGRARPA
jgi:hypothetical protein